MTISCIQILSIRTCTEHSLVSCILSLTPFHPVSHSLAFFCDSHHVLHHCLSCYAPILLALLLPLDSASERSYSGQYNFPVYSKQSLSNSDFIFLLLLLSLPSYVDPHYMDSYTEHSNVLNPLGIIIIIITIIIIIIISSSSSSSI